MNRIVYLIGACWLSMVPALAQEAGNYGFLNLPTSARTAALGGMNISVVEPELGLADQNAALLCPEMAGQLAFSYMNYVSDINIGSVGYAGVLREVGGWSVGMRYVDYGTFDGYSDQGVSEGTFTAKDIALSGAVGYPINDKWRMGACARVLYSSYETYDSWALSVDLGLNYYDEVAGRSFSVTLNHLGGQLKPFEDRRENLPTQIVMGLTKELEHLPFCLSLTAYDLLEWDTDVPRENGKRTQYSHAEQILNHLIFGAEWNVSQQLYFSAAYNFRRQRQFSDMGGFLRGVSLGGGFKSGRLTLQCSYARYNAADGSLVVGCSYQL